MVTTARIESNGHVHRHPAKMSYEHGATKSGELSTSSPFVLDGGPTLRARWPSAERCDLRLWTISAERRGRELPGYTTTPPCGAMAASGAVQACFGHESQMDRLAEALRMDPVELRVKNAIEPGDRFPFGQEVPPPAPVAEILERVKAMPMPEEKEVMGRDLRELPGGVSNTTHGEGVRRGVGYAVSFKNIGFSAGFDDYSTARVILSIEDGEPLVRVHTAAAEVGHGSLLAGQIARRSRRREGAVCNGHEGGSPATSAYARVLTVGAVQRPADRAREALREGPE